MWVPQPAVGTQDEKGWRQWGREEKDKTNDTWVPHPVVGRKRNRV